MIIGSCLCKKITFKLNGTLRSSRYCHCSNCRKFSGASPAAWAIASSADFSKECNAMIGRYDSGHGIRCFCSECGSSVWFESKDYPELLVIPLGAIDSGEVPSPTMHLWVQSKPDWCFINDELPKFREGPESDRAEG